MVDERANRRVPGREACLGSTRPLHRRACGIPLRQGKIIPHADFIAIAQNGRAGQRQHDAVGQFQPPAVAAQHRGEPAPDAAPVKLHVRLRPKLLEHGLTLLLAQPSQVQLVMVAQEIGPLRGFGQRR